MGDTSMRELLKIIVQEKGPEVFDNHVLLAGLLNDYALGEYKKERSVLLRLLSDSPEGDSVLWDPLSRETRIGVEPAIAAPVIPELVLIDGGTFLMGSPLSEPDRNIGSRKNTYDYEKQHQVRVDSFFLGKYAVTQGEYEDVTGDNPSEFKGRNLPVHKINWYEAVIYCNLRSKSEGLLPAYTIHKDRIDPGNYCKYDDFRWLVYWNHDADGYRLPTEAEWEYACRAGTKTTFYTGNSISAYQANFDGTYKREMLPVGSFDPNNWGLYDMHGNVQEWCWDWEGKYEDNAVNPLGPATGECRIRRGGAYLWSSAGIRSAMRSSYPPCTYHTEMGFRLACSIRTM
ncbi:formylglycine-generating enzyme family protein [Treponema primitia]|uniref:formylglycine-generating enzyme family protein n=1 Tax=Treponema primitia TaxID=88058 RepID=UPI0002555332|nr:formylglycine-generating enzyme family protein [Treponema primitia]